MDNKNLTLKPNSNTATPRFAPDEKKDDWTVTYYCGYSPVTPEGVHLSKPQHWYECRCKCGEIETLNQGQLLVRTCCLECTRERRARKISETRLARKKINEPDVPDFARMKLCTSTE